ncbi:hypothetical protein L3X38_025431 [Prunus dulcis]|uniref:Uncharacterized protein n=1 Tax=Prunus dulcis TaxID=3755 RepID=A0AAD4W1T9_PRUDU|nr:hypothetical protein L3X38_025431 [Prunus dulcis]
MRLKSLHPRYGNLSQEEFKEGINSSDHSFRSSNGRKYGDCRPGSSPSEGISQGSSIENHFGTSIARSIERQVLIGSNRRSCPSVPDVVGTVLDPASGIPVSIV